MLVTNQTAQDYYFGPLHLTAGVGQTLTVDDTSDTSLYLTDDAVADALNNLWLAGKIQVSGNATPFPRPTGIPDVLHGTGSPEGAVYAPQGSLFLRRDGLGPNSLYAKTTGVTVDTGWQQPGASGFLRKVTAKDVSNTVIDTDLLNGEITIPANVLGLSGLLRLTAWGDWVQNSGASSDVPIFTLKLGATTLLKTNIVSAAVAAASASRYAWRICCEILNLGASNSQWATMNGSITYDSANASGEAIFMTGEGAVVSLGANAGAKPGIAMFEGANSGAVDTTLAAGNALVLSVINPTATTCDTKLYGAVIEIV